MKCNICGKYETKGIIVTNTQTNISLCSKCYNEKITESLFVFNENTGHFTNKQKVLKLFEEVAELQQAVRIQNETEIINECSDVLAIAFHIAAKNGYAGTPNDLFIQAAEKMKMRVKNGIKDYKNKDF